MEPVEPGTNLAALKSSSVDLLAHPGILTDEEAILAKTQQIFVELSARPGHSLSNGHVARTALNREARLLLDSDAHGPEDLLRPDLSLKIAKGAGLNDNQTHTLLVSNPKKLLTKLGYD